MRAVDEMLGDPGLWGGLHRPGITRQEADILLWGIPFDGAASFRKGAAEAPRAIRNITFSICPTTEDLLRSEERRVGKECRSRWSPYH